MVVWTTTTTARGGIGGRGISIIGSSGAPSSIALFSFVVVVVVVVVIIVIVIVCSLFIRLNVNSGKNRRRGGNKIEKEDVRIDYCCCS